MRPPITAALPPINAIQTPTGKWRAVCEFCGRQSRPVAKLSIWTLSWTVAPYSDDFVHEDGSTGNLWECPTCARRMRDGEGLWPRCEPRKPLRKSGFQ
jgi:hypothetical protein